MSADTTIFIPTHCRPGYLRRALAYYAGAGAEIVVADSSPQAFPQPPAGVRYLHFPGLDYMSKLSRALEHIRTPYVVFCADDDFTVPRAIRACRDFLEANPGHVTAQGDYYAAEPQAGQVHMRRIYAQADQVRVDADSPEERLLQINDPYIPTFYAVQRVQVLRDYVAVAGDGLSNYNMLELCSAMVGAIHGKHGQLPLFYGVREAVPSHAPKDPRRRHGVEVVSRQPEYAAEFALFVERTAGLLRREHGLDPDRAQAAVRASVEAFVVRYCVHTPRRGFLRKLPKYVRRILNPGGEAAARLERADQERRELESRFSVYDTQAGGERELVARLVSQGAP